MNQTLVKYLILVFSLFISSAKIIPQQINFPEGSPEWLVQQFFKSEIFPDKEKYFTGEMKTQKSDPTIGEELKGKGEVSFYAFLAVDHQKAFSVNIKLNSTDLDFYCFTKYSENIWTIESVKRFLFPKFIYIAADSLRSLTTLTSADSSMLKLLNLMTASDDLLKEYLNENLNKFEQLLKYFNQNDKDSIKILIDELSLNGIFKDNKYPGCIFIQIGEMQAREVGYIVNIDGAKLPEISPEDFVYVELIIPGWYLYRLM